MRKQKGLAWGWLGAGLVEELREGRGEYVAWQSLESQKSQILKGGRKNWRYSWGWEEN